MPNHITNRLTLHCDADTAKLVLDRIRGEDDQLIDFNKLIQYPLKYAKADRTREKWEKNSRLSGIMSTPPADGYNNGGYEWCVKNWGTKWNAYNITKCNERTILFQTAWRTPLGIFERLAKRFFTLKFTVEYADENIGYNTGRLEYQENLLDHTTYEGVKAVKLYFNLTGYNPVEYGYDPVTFERVTKEDEE